MRPTSITYHDYTLSVDTASQLQVAWVVIIVDTVLMMHGLTVEQRPA